MAVAPRKESFYCLRRDGRDKRPGGTGKVKTPGELPSWPVDSRDLAYDIHAVRLSADVLHEHADHVVNGDPLNHQTGGPHAVPASKNRLGLLQIPAVCVPVTAFRIDVVEPDLRHSPSFVPDPVAIMTQGQRLDLQSLGLTAAHEPQHAADESHGDTSRLTARFLLHALARRLGFLDLDWVPAIATLIPDRDRRAPRLRIQLHPQPRYEVLQQVVPSLYHLVVQ